MKADYLALLIVAVISIGFGGYALIQAKKYQREHRKKPKRAA